MKRSSGLPRVEQDYFIPQGGLDLVTPPLLTPPGSARDAQNFESAIDGGYRRIDGYERFSGLPASNEMQWFRFKFVAATSGTAQLVVGYRMKGVTSGATAVVVGTELATTPTIGGVPLYVNAASTDPASVGWVMLTDVAGTFVLGEQIQQLAPDGNYYDLSAVVAKVGVLPVPATGPSLTIAGKTYEQTCANAWRALSPNLTATFFTATTGQAPLGLVELNGIPHLVTLIVNSFTGAVSQALVLKPQYPSIDEWKTHPKRKGWSQASLAGPVTIGGTIFPTIPTSLRTISYNFGGAASQRKVYGVSGVGTAFSYDGLNFVSIPTGMANDKPTAIAAHKNRLFLAFGASLQFSAAGDPLTWSAVLGAGEIATGDPITELVPLVGANNQSSALLVCTATKLYLLYGDSAANFNLVLLDPEMGAQAKTVQVIGGRPYFFNDFGLVSLAATQDFGNFAASTITYKLQPLIQSYRRRALCSTLVRSKNQYRIFFDDGTALYVTIRDDKVIGIMPVRFPEPVQHVLTYFDSAGRELVLFTMKTGGNRSGYMYRMDAGQSFDGDPISAYLLMAFNSFKSPRVKKAFRRAVLEFQVPQGNVSLQAGVDVDYANYEVSPSPDTNVSNPNYNPAANFDDSQWDQYQFDGYNANQVVLPIDGSGDSLAIRISSASDMTPSFTLSGALINYIVRRQER